MQRALVRSALIVSLIAGLAAVPLAQPAAASTLPPGYSESVISGLNQPTAMAFAPDGRLFVSEQGGHMRIIQNGALLPNPFFSIPVDNEGERGLLGIAFPPNFATSKRVYVYFTKPTPAPHNVVAWFGGADTNTATTGPHIVTQLPNLSSATNHNGGAIHFGNDGQLYVSVGENADPTHSQDLTSPLGKMLRITMAGDPSPGNPTFNGAPHDPRVWAYGLRNPFTFNVDHRDGTIFIDDVGSGGNGTCNDGVWEEINVGAPGANYGWPLVEGGPTTPDCTKPGITYPLVTYSHSDPSGPCAIAGGTFYDQDGGLLDPSLSGAYFFSDLCGGWIRYRLPNGTLGQLASGIPSPVDLQVSPDGALYYLARGLGAVGRIEKAQAPWNVFLRNTTTSGTADEQFTYGSNTDGVLFCDWNGDGIETIGLHRGNQWLLRNSNTAGAPDVTFTFGNPTDIPVCGDWNGDGIATIGVYRNNTFMLRNSNSTGPPTITTAFGDPGDIPVVGDWNGDGRDTIGVRRGDTFILSNSNTTGVATITAKFGDPTDQPVIGDWNADGKDSIGVYRGRTFYFRNSNSSGFAAFTASFGDPGDRPVAGHFTATGGDGIGVLR
jgi:glucose/arabinose dehydrogenase